MLSLSHPWFLSPLNNSLARSYVLPATNDIKVFALILEMRNPYILRKSRSLLRQVITFFLILLELRGLAGRNRKDGGGREELTKFRK